MQPRTFCELCALRVCLLANAYFTQSANFSDLFFAVHLSAKCLLYSVQLFSPFVSTNSRTLCSTDYGKLVLFFYIPWLQEWCWSFSYTVSRNCSHTWLPYQACDSGTGRVIFVFCLPGVTGGSKHFQEVTVTVTDATESPLWSTFFKKSQSIMPALSPQQSIFFKKSWPLMPTSSPLWSTFSRKSQSQTTTLFPANCSMYANSCAVLSPEIPTLSRIHCRSWLPRNTQQKNASPSSQARTRRSENVLRLWIATDLPKLKVIWNSTRPRALVQNQHTRELISAWTM